MFYIHRNYERLVRPVFNASKPVVIKMGLTLAQVFDMVGMIEKIFNFSCYKMLYFQEEKTQILVTNVWLDIEWRINYVFSILKGKIKFLKSLVDEFLKWDPEEFNGLKIFRVSTKKIW